MVAVEVKGSWKFVLCELCESFSEKVVKFFEVGGKTHTAEEGSRRGAGSRLKSSLVIFLICKINYSTIY
jgi:hypothetical protein